MYCPVCDANNHYHHHGHVNSDYHMTRDIVRVAIGEKSLSEITLLRAFWPLFTELPTRYILYSVLLLTMVLVGGGLVAHYIVFIGKVF